MYPAESSPRPTLATLFLKTSINKLVDPCLPTSYSKVPSAPELLGSSARQGLAPSPHRCPKMHASTVFPRV